MEQGNKKLLIKYLICFGVASLLTLAVFWIKGFFTDSLSVNLQILSDGFVISGLLLVSFAGLLYINGEGGLIGVSFIFRNILLAIIPMGRMKHEVYAKYYERKMETLKKSREAAALVVGLIFLAIGIVFTVIWYVKFYQVPV